MHHPVIIHGRRKKSSNIENVTPWGLITSPQQIETDTAFLPPSVSPGPPDVDKTRHMHWTSLMISGQVS
jgi:hypothetical protein